MSCRNSTEAAPSDPAPRGRTRPRVKRTRRQRIAATLAASSAAVLALTAILPTFTAITGAIGSPAAALEPAIGAQHLHVAQQLSSVGAHDAIGAVEIGLDPRTDGPYNPETGLLDPGDIPETELGYALGPEHPLTDGFAYRTAPVEQFHDAQDIAAPAGTEVRAIGSGIVLDAGYATDGCGFSIKLQHTVGGETLTSRYCHMLDGSHEYSIGDTVALGDAIGQVGNTGLSFGPHLHLALRLGGVPIDPLPYLDAQIKSSAK
ncbi:MAG: M23 family metallopeptidase [Leucobacter sp.]